MEHNMEIEIKMARLHAAQAEIRQSKARFKVLACGRRFGKTTVAVDGLCDVLLAGQSAAYFAPTYRMGAEVWRTTKELYVHFCGIGANTSGAWNW